MNLYRHYKNQLYRLIDVVRHSETLEDLLLYETLYDNPRAKLWVRPKAMFFETVEHEGKVKPRFAKVDIQIESFTEWNNQTRETIEAIGHQCFEEWKTDVFALRLASYQSFHISVAKIDGQAVAFKIGYEIAPHEFYSWLGAVLPSYQRMGIASSLMEAQHDWCLAHSYQMIRSKCLNFNLAMLKANLKHGFLVIDTEVTEEGLKLVLEKRLQGQLA